MSVASSAEISSTQTATQALRIVLFGAAGAGKTALLRALAQAALTQQPLLRGRLTGASQRFDSLRNGDDKTKAVGTSQVLEPYPLQFEASTGKAPLDLVVYDSSGAAAEDLIERQLKLGSISADGLLGQQLLDADAIILTLDASASPDELAATFGDLNRFLGLFERQRGGKIEISGLPVYLVLTKCDLLARPGDTSVLWLERIEDHKHRVQQAFESYLAGRDQPFGGVELHLWATAVARPALAGSRTAPRKPAADRTTNPPAQAIGAAATSTGTEPFGVAELFRQVLERSEHFRAQQARATRRLYGAVIGGGMALGVLLALIVVFIANRPHPLHDRLPADEPVAAVRLAGPTSRLEARLRGLESLSSDPDFATLPEAQRDRIHDLIQELQEYLELSRRLDDLLTPGARHSLSEAEDIKVPKERSKQWANTEVVRDLDALHAAGNGMDVKGPRGWYTHLHDMAQRQIEQTPQGDNEEEWAGWSERSAALLRQAQAPPFEDGDRWGGSRITCGMLLQFNEISTVKEAWQKTDRPLLVRLRDICAALGLNRDAGKQPLDIPPPTRSAAFQPQQWSARAAQLHKEYPRYETEFTLRDLPQRSAPGIRKAAKRRYELALPIARHVVLQRYLELGTDSEGETPERWQRVRAWLTQPNELDPWRQIADVLLRLSKPEAKDPVADLAAFLDQKAFTVKLATIRIDIPLAAELTPGRELRIYHPGRDTLCCTLTRSGEPTLDEPSRTRRYLYQASSTVNIRYIPGEHLSARLSVKDVQNNEAIFTWGAAADRGQSTVYQFLSLLLTPFRHRENQDFDKGIVEDGVVLRVEEGECRPLPSLFPDDLHKR